jgi:hypothetical protein
MFSWNLTSRQIMNAVWAVGASTRFEACVERPIVIDASKSREFSNGVLTFIPGVYEQFRPSSESDAILTITSDHPPVSTPEPGRWPVAAAGFLGFVTLRVFSREFKVRSL